MLKVFLDVDGVICSFHTHFTNLAREEYGNHIPILINKEDVKNWDFYKYLPITKDQENFIFEKIKKDKNFWLKIPHLNKDDFYYFVRELNDIPELDVYFITTRSNTGGFSATKATAIWLESYGWKNPMVIANVKDKKKSIIVNALDIKIGCDDSGLNCLDVAQNCPDCEIFMMAYPHNENTKHKKITRINSLKEYVDIIKNKMEKNNGK